MDRAGDALAVGRHEIATALGTEEANAVELLGQVVELTLAVFGSGINGAAHARQRAEIMQASDAVVLRPGEPVVGKHLVPVLRPQADHAVSGRAGGRLRSRGGWVWLAGQGRK